MIPLVQVGGGRGRESKVINEVCKETGEMSLKEGRRKFYLESKMAWYADVLGCRKIWFLGLDQSGEKRKEW